MDKTQLKRHDMVFLSQQGKDRLWQRLSVCYKGEQLQLLREILQGVTEVPAFVRRNTKESNEIAIGFVHPQRISGNRFRIGTFADDTEIVTALTPYEVMQRKAFAFNAESKCIQTVIGLYQLAGSFDLQVGILGSAALELMTDLPYTDADSDIDLLVKPAAYEKLFNFYLAAKENFPNINMDFEVDLPNGYGVKLAEIFMDTQTVLGKSLEDVTLLYRKDIMQYLV